MHILYHYSLTSGKNRKGCDTRKKSSSEKKIYYDILANIRNFWQESIRVTLKIHVYMLKNPV